MISLEIILILITAFYAFQTYRSNKIMKDSLYFSYRPYLALDDIDVERIENITNRPDKVFFQIQLKLKNVGKVPLRYHMKQIVISADDKIDIPVKYASRGNFIFPSQITTFFCGELLELNKLPLQTLIDYELEYYSTIERNVIYKSRKKIELIIFADNKKRWLFLEEEED